MKKETVLFLFILFKSSFLFAQTEEIVKAGHTCYSITRKVCGAQCCMLFKEGTTIYLDQDGAATAGVIKNNFTTEYGFIAKGDNQIMFADFTEKEVIDGGRTKQVSKLVKCTLYQNSLIATIGFSSSILYKANTEITMQGSYYVNSEKATSGTIVNAISVEGTIIPAGSFIQLSEADLFSGGKSYIRIMLSYKLQNGEMTEPINVSTILNN